MTEGHKLPGTALWIILAMVVVLAEYPLSWGPSIFVCETAGEPPWLLAPMEVLYYPMVLIVRAWGKSWVLKPYIAYQDWWIRLAVE